MSGRVPILAKRLLLSLATVGVALGALELVLRLVGYDPMGSWLRDRGRGRVIRVSALGDLRYELVPNAEGEGWGASVRINSHGFRDREYPLDKGDAYRIVVVGDSITFGNGLDAEQESYPKRLEESLAARFPRPVEVLNLGVGGYDVVQVVAQLEHRGTRFDPDLVILGFCVNDIGDYSVNQEYLERLERLESPLHRIRLVQLGRVFADRVGAAWVLLAGATDEEFAEAKRGYVASVDGDPELVAMIDEVRSVAFQERLFGLVRTPRGVLSWWGSPVHLGMLEYAFERLAGLKAREGFEVLVVVLPWLEDDDEWDTVYRIVAHEAHKFGLPTVELDGALEAEDFPTLRNGPLDRLHPNARGHRVIADALERHLLASGLAESVARRAPLRLAPP